MVTQLSLDHGMIDDTIYFTSKEVLGGVPLKEGDLVNCIAIRCGAEEGWKAVRVRTLFSVSVATYVDECVAFHLQLYLIGFCLEMSLELHCT